MPGLRTGMAGVSVALWLLGCSARADNTPAVATAAVAAAGDSVVLTDQQLAAVSVQAVAERTFTREREAPGSIDFNQDLSVQVSPPYQGRILQLFARSGDRITKGQTLFTIDSPDLVQAESTLISAAGVLKLTSSVLERAKGLYAIQGLAQKDYQQAVSDQQGALAAYGAARDAVRIFGKTDAEIDRIVQQRRVDARMRVSSPISGVVTARNAAPGALAQPGASPAPYIVSDLATKWVLADLPETDLPAVHLGQPLEVRLPAYPDHVFHARVTNIAEAVDPATRRATVRAQIADPHDQLRAQMFANITMQVGAPIQAPAVPVDAVVRDGDGTMNVWVASDQHRFVRRQVTLGEQQAGYEQIVTGLQAGERIAATGALFISNAAVQGGAD